MYDGWGRGMGMTFRDASKLHNEDEVIDKVTGESIRVLSVKRQYCGQAIWVLIEGVGEEQGHGEWLHTHVR